jgi:hypothetical protein
MTKPNEHAEKYYAAKTAHDNARRAHDAAEKIRNPLIETWTPDKDEPRIMCLETEIEMHDAARELNENDPSIAALRSWFAQALDKLAARYDEIERASSEAPTLAAVTSSDLDAFCARRVALTDPEHLRKVRVEISRAVDAVFETFAAALAQLADAREAAGLPHVPPLYSTAKFPALIGGAPIRVLMTSAAPCRLLAQVVREHKPVDYAAGARNELRQLELRTEAWIEQQAIEQAAREERERAWERSSPGLR